VLSRIRVSAFTVGAVAAVAATLVLSGCGAATSAPPAQSQTCTTGQITQKPDPAPMTVNAAADPAAAAQVPASFKSKGTLTIATDASYAPNEFTAQGSGDIIGMDVDLGTAIGQTLGMKTKFVNASFDGILAGIQAGRYDMGMSSFTDTKEREQTVDFVTYFTAGTSTMVTSCNPKKISTVTDLCGKTVGAEQGTTQLDQLSKADVDGSVVKQCQDGGKPVPNAKGFPKQTDVNSALQAGRIDAYMADSPVVDYALAQTGGVFKKVGGDLDTAPYGIAVPKNAGTLKNAVQAAVQKLMDDGTYKQILAHWGVSSGAITQAGLNGATS
jgi:polar amino acid transport system substrate-binding protein